MPVFETISWLAQTVMDRRRSLREIVRYSAWIDVGLDAPPRRCAVLDVSEGGARILFPSGPRLPEEFSLVFTKYGSIRRRCRLVWRSRTEVGLSYLGPLECEGPSNPRSSSILRH